MQRLHGADALFLYGETGFVSRAVMAVLGLREPPWRLVGAPAILLVHAYSMYVYFYLFTRAGLARLDESMLEAAASLGSGRWRTVRRVAPTKSCRGRPIFWSGSEIISFHCAIQPTVRASAKMPVNSDTGMPSARCTMPE